MQQPSPFVAGEPPRPACCIHKWPGYRHWPAASGGPAPRLPGRAPQPAASGATTAACDRCPVSTLLPADQPAAAGALGMQEGAVEEAGTPPALAPSRSVQNSDAVLMDRCKQVCGQMCCLASLVNGFAVFSFWVPAVYPQKQLQALACCICSQPPPALGGLHAWAGGAAAALGP